MSTALHKQKAPTPPSILGADVNHALQELIRLSKKLVDFADQETKSLVTRDAMLFAFTQKDKEILAERYAQASEEFRSRLDDFRRADRGLLMKLERLQEELRQKTHDNNMAIEQVKEKVSASTQATLFSAQEMGQRVRFNTPETNTQKQKEA